MAVWGKLQRDKGGGLSGVEYGLLDHCCDVVAVFEALVQVSAFRRILERAANRQLSEGHWRLLSYFVFLHDLGKCNWGFQAKRDPGAAHTAGHVREVGGLIGRSDLPAFLKFMSSETVFRESIEGILLSASIAHHGEPVVLEPKFGRQFWDPALGQIPIQAVNDMVAFASDAFGAPNASDLDWLAHDERAAAFTHAFAGLVSLADWIGSNPAPEFFPYHGHEPGRRLEWARSRAEVVVKAMTLDTSLLRDGLIGHDLDFQRVFTVPYAPNAMQKAAGVKLDGPITCIEAPTGSGKTEAALWHFLHLFQHGLVDGLYFALPMRTAATQIHERLRAFVAGTFPDATLRPNLVLALPGYLRENDADGQRLPGFEVLWPDREAGETSDLSYLRWAAEHPKRFLAATLAAGTIDQALLSVLQTRHSHLRGATLSRHLLVIDEVHASDAYQGALIRALLRRHVKLGGRALLLSATLTEAARIGFLHPDRKNTRHPRQANVDCGVTPAKGPSPYPLLSTPSYAQAIPFSGSPKATIMQPTGLIDDPAEIARLAINAAQAGARVLIIRNTVAGVLAVQQALEAACPTQSNFLFKVAGQSCPHHGRYHSADRQSLDCEVEVRFGKGAISGRGCVLVGSQTLEISIDCDADLLITDLCPADVLLQRLGRLHRHDKPNRPSGYESGRAIILTPETRDLTPFTQQHGRKRHGFGQVYPDILMMDLTWQALLDRPVWTTPTDNRFLVESCIGDEALARALQGRSVDWERNRNLQIGERGAFRQAASRHLCDWDIAWSEQPWAGDLGETVATRLGLRTLQITFAQNVRTVFGNEIRTLDIPGWVKFPADMPFDDKPIATTTDSDGAICFELRGRLFRYGRFGLEV
ncbi:CRISPR-associated helicase/endonuclease Cas3 [Aquidulcibacter paucihalophilus]|uniref:CRISPR-associated helicase/endonuclease Cas3 n=1 Tax=Aquidulcibacter paucihalophilus TaxID=1978549 RepID=UPI000A199709|nr:CRISPR-associated helicase/endonuclease Cas3 [Aquidulcibacter paucihalophilus]